MKREGDISKTEKLKSEIGPLADKDSAKDGQSRNIFAGGSSGLFYGQIFMRRVLSIVVLDIAMDGTGDVHDGPGTVGLLSPHRRMLLR